MLFIDEIHRIARPAEEMLYLAMEDFRVDVVVGKGPGRDRDPARDRAVHAGRRHHPGRAAARRRCATGSASPRTWTSTSAAELEQVLHRSAGLLGVRLPPTAAHEIAGRSRGHAPDRQPAAAPGPRLRRGARRRGGHPGRRPAALPVYEVDAEGLDRLDRAVLGALVGSSAAARSACRRWRWRWGRSRRRSRRSPSRSWCAGPAGPHPAGPGRHRRGLGAPGADPAAGRVRAELTSLRISGASDVADGKYRLSRR